MEGSVLGDVKDSVHRERKAQCEGVWETQLRALRCRRINVRGCEILIA